MSKPSTGSPAFPEVRIINGDIYNPSTKVYYPGMTLRDYFAAKAMVGIVSTRAEHGVFDFNEISSDSYMLADAMLKQRDAA